MSFSENLKLKWDSSLISLIITNLIVIALAIIQKWDFPTVIYIYLAQSIIIGIFYFLKVWLIQNKNTNISNNNDKLTLSLILLIVVFSFFMLVYYLMLPTLLFFNYCFSLFSPIESGFTCAAATPNLDIYFYLGIFLFFINHFLSFINNFKKDSENISNASIIKLMLSPIIRIIPIHITLILGVFFFKSAVVFLLILKTIIDVYTHYYIYKDLDSKKSIDTDLQIKEEQALTDLEKYVSINKKSNPYKIFIILISIIIVFFYGLLLGFVFMVIGVIIVNIIFNKNTNNL